ncbi:MAG: amino acid adenylation domain-containing protein, partial [Algicola sp.]|nr:amino acid adenylation domain-containing protein [Algicola sp.]
YRGKDHHFALDGELSNQLRDLAKSQQTTLYTVLLSGFYVTLASLTGQSDIVVGTPSDGRQHSQTQDLIGFFINSLVLRAQVDSSQNLIDLIGQVHTVVTQGKVHQALPFEKLLDTLAIKRDRSRHPIYQVMFGAHSVDQSTLATNRLPFEPVDLDDGQSLYSPAKFDLSVFMSDEPNQIIGAFNYAVALFDESSIQRMAELYLRVLKALVNVKQQVRPIADIELLANDERDTLLHQWQSAKVDIEPVTMAQQFEAQVAKTPDNVAVVFDGQSLSYRELNNKANQLAHTLAQMLTDTDDGFVALYLERGIDMVTAILAVLKAGGAYVPISPDTPQSRTAFILSDTAAKVILTQNSCHEALMGSLEDKSSICVLNLDDQPLNKSPFTNLTVQSNPQDLAYVIYTSGTTGQPKGVMIEHRAVVSLIEGQTRAFDFSAQEVVIWLASYTFDASVEQLFLALFNGASVYIPSLSQVKDAAQLKRQIIVQQVTHLHATPQYLAALGEFDSANNIKRVICGGDVVDERLKQIWADKLINEYGPTEVTVTAVQSLDFAQHNAINCIGKPLNNTRAYVLSAQKRLVPIGTPGELYIGGTGVARGYLNLPELTAERFVADPFVDGALVGADNTRMYKTGDRVRWSPDGQLHFLGRSDNQVKIRGFRIELEEIQCVLNALPEVKQAVVIARKKSDDKYLAAYVVAQAGQTFELTVLNDKLPEYMVPATLTYIDSVPLNVNGKLDLEALPEPEFVNVDCYVAPRDAREQQLCTIWQDVLGLAQVGIEDDFFAMGGDSIKAIRLTAAMGKHFDVDVPLALLFDQPKIASLAGLVSSQDKVVIEAVEQSQYPLSFAQERLLFIESFEQGSDAYHIPYFVELLDSDVNLMQQAINAVIDVHPVLKTVYLNDGKADYQQVLPQLVLIPTIELTPGQSLLTKVKADISQPFDLTTQPSIRLNHYVCGQQNYLLILFHHIAFDGWSNGLFMQALSSAYQALKQGNPVDLPQPTISYGDYALWQREQLKGETLDALLGYWQQHLSGFETLDLITDHARPAKPDYRGKDHLFALDEILSGQLRALAKSQQTTLYTVLLSGFYVTLAGITGQSDVVVGTPSDNRHHAQTQDLIGFFVNSLAFRAQVDPTQSITGLIEQVHDIVIQGKVHQELPFEKLVDGLDVERDMSRHPIYQVLFSLQSFAQNDEVQKQALPFEPVDLDEGQSLYSPAKFDLSLHLNNDKASISGGFNYAVSLFEPATITRFEATYRRVLNAFVDDNQQNRPIGEIDLLSRDDRRVLQQWQQTDVAGELSLLHRQFEAQVDKVPHHVALVCGELSLSYQ